jgi:translation initiation factor IF-3
LSRPFTRPSPPPGSSFKINGKIRAREVRIIGVDGAQMGVYALHEAISLARQNGVDLVEIAPNATPPVARLVDYGKFRYEQAKKDKDAKKHQHATKVKEVQLSCSIDPHDFQVKMNHGIDFLCEDMKIKITLRFRGREMMHKDIGFQCVKKYTESLTPYGHPDAPPKLIGKGITVMISPLPRAKRAKHPNDTGDGSHVPRLVDLPDDSSDEPLVEEEEIDSPQNQPQGQNPNREQQANFRNNPFEQLG